MKNNDNNFEKLKVWQEAHALVLQLYKTTKTFPSEERFRLVDQICRAVSSVAANIVEGNSRKSKKEFKQFTYLAKGSLEEVKYHLLLARDLQYINENEYNDLVDQANRVGMLLTGLIKFLTTNI